MTAVKQIKVWSGTEWVLVGSVADPLPDQTGNTGKYLTTDGVDLSWGVVISGSASGGGGAVGGGSDQIFYENDITVTTDYTITTNKNAMTAGPITISASATVTIPDGSVWVIV